MLQQYLPFTVLKPSNLLDRNPFYQVATVLTVYGIETFQSIFNEDFSYVATVLTVYGIETLDISIEIYYITFSVATVLTVYGIETLINIIDKDHSLVATVLTVYGIETLRVAKEYAFKFFKLQQYLPFTVLKPMMSLWVLCLL